MSEVTASRRDAMRALSIIPATLALPTGTSAAVGLVCTPSDAAGWDAAMRTYLDARAMHEAHYGDEALCDAMIEAEDVLTNLPAPNMAAVEWKLRYLQQEAEHNTLVPGTFDRLISDVRRLAGEA